MNGPHPYAHTYDLPPYQGILAVDAKGFTDEPGVVQQDLSGSIPQLVGLAFENIGLGEVWNNPVFFGPTGDGFAVGVPTRVVPSLIHPFLLELQNVLAGHNRSIRAGEPRIRLRVSLNIGPVAEGANVYLAGNGAARNDTHRLLDSRPVKAILSAASPEVTLVAAIISDRVYQEVVRQGFAGRHPDHFLEVAATVDGKAFAQTAWLHVPQPSGSLLAAGLPAEPKPASATPVPRPAAARDAISIEAPHNSGQVAGRVRSMRQERKA